MMETLITYVTLLIS